MTAISVSGASRPAFNPVFRPSKTPRDRLLHLHVEGERDTPFLAELLDLVRDHAFTPLSMAINVGGARMTVRIDIDREREGVADALVERLRNCPAVRKATFAAQD
jgi:hypothetical protein